MAATESDIAAQLIERLLADPAFRDRFRRDPVLACRQAGLEELAEEMRLGGGKAMHTLDIRESRSSLAGVMMAAAMEGMGMYEFSKHVVPHIEDLTGSLGDVLSRVNLPALPGQGSLAGGPAPSAAPLVEPEAAADPAADAGGGGGAAATPAAPASPEEAAAKPGKAAAADAGAGAAKEKKPPAPPELAAEKPPEKDPAKERAGGDGLRTGTPDGSELPEGPGRLEPSDGGPEPAAPPPAPPVEPAAPSAPVDPGQLGQDGSGGSANAEARALLENKNIVLDDVGVSDIKAGKIDPRIVAVLTKLSQEHKISVSCMCSDHSKFTAGGSISNHAFGRGLDIASIDGEIVSPGSALARDIASELSDLDPQIRPDEIGSPFAISGPGYFTDADHQDHIHVGFKQQITPDFKLPAELRAGGAQAAPVPGAPGAGAVVDAAAGGGGGGSLGDAALRIAQTQRGVREVGTNTGPKVDEYLEAAGVAPGNPWCAAFVTWSLQQAGHKMPGSGWAGVATWVGNAEQGNNGLKLVSAEEARPGDIVAYDWGGGSDFGADGHIGFLASGVKDGQFSALEGNNADAVNLVPRRVGGGANVVFIRPEGDAPAGAAPAGAPAVAGAAAVAAAPAAPELAGVPAAPAPDPSKDSGLFAALAQPGQLASAAPDPAKPGDSQLFLQAAQSQAKAAPAADPAAAPAAAAPAGAPAAELAAVTEYPGDDAPKEQIAAWMATEAKKRGLPPQLPVMASLVESGLKNLNFGDADSVGFFQMRLSIWNNQPEYAGYPENPDKQLDWFLDQAEAIKAQRVSRGQPIDDPNQFGEWIADVERPAEQFRGRYQLQLDQANNLLKTAPAQPPAPATPAAPAAPAPAAPAAAPVEPAAPSAPVDPGQLGQDGSGGSANAEARALLENKNIVLDDVGVSDIKAGKIDPRIVAVLTKLSQEHKISVSCMCSDHSKFTAGGSISNHAFGRGLDIASIDGEIVSPGSALARDIASELSDLDPQIRPDEIGSPFAISGPGYFTDADHQDHIHVGFKQQITPDFKLPAELAAGGAPAAPAVAGAAAVAAAPAAPELAGVPAAPAPDPSKDSGLFAALAQPGQLASAAPDPAKPGDSQLFLQAAQSQAKAAPAADPAAAPAAAAPAGAPAAELAAVTEYPGDDAPKEQIAAWMATEAKKRGLPPQLPVMASLVESGLKNLNFGDADSVGFFQMRLSIWNNQPEYAGYPENPDKQLDWFLDQAEAIKAQRVSRGQPIDDPNQFGEWIADVERPAEQFRGRYQLQLDQANNLLKTAPAQPPAPATPAHPRTRARSTGGGAVAGRARRRSRRRRRRPAGDGAGPGPQGDRGAEGGREVHRHAVPLGRLDARDRLRLLRPGAVGLRAGRREDPARDVRPDRRDQRHAGRARGAAPGRPGVLPRLGRLRAPRRHLDGRRQVPARPAHRRRRQGLEPQRGVLQGAVHGRAPVRRHRRRRLRPPRRRRPRPRRPLRPRPRSTPSPSRPRRLPSHATRPRRGSRTAACSGRSSRRRRATTRRPAWTPTARWPPPAAKGRCRATLRCS